MFNKTRQSNTSLPLLKPRWFILDCWKQYQIVHQNNIFFHTTGILFFLLLFYFYLIFETSYILTWPPEKAPENNSSFVLSHRYLPESFSVFCCSEYPVAWLTYHQSSFSWHYLLQKILSQRSCFHSSWEIKHLDWISVLHEVDPQVAVEQKFHIKHCFHQPHFTCSNFGWNNDMFCMNIHVQSRQLFGSLKYMTWFVCTQKNNHYNYITFYKRWSCISSNPISSL